jgi:hypothetical protein
MSLWQEEKINNHQALTLPALGTAQKNFSFSVLLSFEDLVGGKCGGWLKVCGGSSKEKDGDENRELG